MLPQEMSAEQLMLAQALAQEDLYFFSRFMFAARNGHNWVKADHHAIVCEALMKVFRGETQFLIINIPPRYSKTELAVINFVSWAMGRVPDSEWILPSYVSALAVKNSYAIREMCKHEAYQGIFPKVQIASDSSAKGDWGTTEGGRVYAPGVGGPTTGMGAGKMREGFGGCIIIDDPHKADDARSDTMLQNAIDWYHDTLQSRRNNPKTPIILIMQRLNEDDLSGHLLGGGSGEKWEHLCLPAIQPDGSALWPWKHSIEALRVLEKSRPFMFAGQYMQTPSSAQGLVFKPDQMDILPALPLERIKWVRGWDFAGSVPEKGTDPDWTAGVRLGERPNGRYIVAHVVREQGTPDTVEALLKSTAKMDGMGVQVDIPQDPGQAGKGQVLSFTRLLKGYRVSSSPESGDKVTRAESFAAQVNVGNVDMIAGEWNEAFVNELRVFPNGKKDDQVDAASRAFNKLMSTPAALHISKALLRKTSR